MNRVKGKITLLVGIFSFFTLNFFTQSAPTAKADTSTMQVVVQDTLTVKMSDYFKMEIAPDDTPHFETNAFMVNVMTNNKLGYRMFMETDNSNLVNEENENETIPYFSDSITIKPTQLDTISTMPKNTWGIGIYENTNFVSVYNNYLIPLDDYTYIGQNTSVSSSDKILFSVGARVDDTIPAGKYTATINLTIVPAIATGTISSISYMQDMSSTVVSSMTQGEAYKLIDIRDNKEYYVSRHGSNVAMVQNLDYDFEEKRLTSPVSNIYSYSNGSVTSDFKMKIITSVKNTPSTDVNQAVYQSGNNIYRDDGGTETTNNNPPETAAEANNKAGGYYSYAAAVANTKNLSTGTGMSYNSICPSGWEIPSYEDAKAFDTYSTSYMGWSNNNGFIGLANNLILDNGQQYWTAETDIPNNRARTYIPGGDGTTFLDTRSLASLRCIYKTKYDFIYKIEFGHEISPDTYNVGTWTRSTSQQFISAESWDTFTKNIKIPGYKLIGFAEYPNATIPTISLSQLDSSTYAVHYKRIKPLTTIYAVWAPRCNSSALSIDTAVCLQDMNSYIKRSMTVNQQYQLIDIRDGKKYWIARLPNNKVYMTQNLDYNPGYYKVHLPAESNVYTPTSGGFSESDIQTEEGYFMKNGEVKTSLDEQQSEEDLHYKIGAYYSTGRWDTGINIYCPKGWRPANMIDVLSAVGIEIESGKIYTNDPNTTIEDAVVDTSITKEKLLGAPLYLGLTGTRFNNTSMDQGYEGMYRTDTYVLSNSYSGTYGYAGGSFRRYDSFSYNDTNIGVLDFSVNGDVVTLFDTSIVNQQVSTYQYSTPGQVRCYTDAIGLDELEYMQDINFDVILNTPTEIEMQLTDKRDGKKYWIAKDKNGEVRMTQNLDFEIPATGVNINYDMTSSGHVNFNLQSVRQWNDRTDANAVVYIDGGDYYLEDGLEKTSTEGLAEDSEKWHYHIGSYYSSAAARAGYLDQTSFEYSNICPSGWTIPETGYKRYYYTISSGSLSSNSTNTYYIGYESSQSEYVYRVYSGWYERPSSSDPFTPILYNYGERAYYHSGYSGSRASLRYITTSGGTSYHYSPTTEAAPMRCVAKFPQANYFDH